MLILIIKTYFKKWLTTMKSDQIKKQRLSYRMTQKQFAIALGLSEINGDRYTREVESGRKTPSGLFIRCFELFVENQHLKNTL